MEMQTSKQLISSHLKEYPIKDYFVGLDIGAASVGWAVTNQSYELLKFRSHKMWGSRLFDEAESAVGRRSFRSIRRRLERRKLRLKLLEELFADAMAQVDPTFFMRLRESKYHYEDKTTGHSSKHILFIDKDYTDQDYFKEYPTIYHLRAELMKSGTDDIRKLFLAVHHILKYRGNFLYEGATFDSNASTLDDVLKQALENITFNCFDCNSAISAIGQVLMDAGKTKSDKAKAIERLVDTYIAADIEDTSSKTQKEQVKEDKKRLKAFANLVLGLSASLTDLFGSVEELDDDLKKLQITGDTYDDKREELAKAWGDEIHIIDDCKSVYDAIILMAIKEPGLTISESKVKAFNKHKEDLVILKSLLKTDRSIYNTMFKADEKGLHNYVHYIKQGRTEETSCNREDFYKYTKKVVEGLPDSKDKEYILSEIELQTLLPLQRIKDNGVIPYQLHLEELKTILKTCGPKFPFLNEVADGYTVAEKLIKMLEFRIPYYVGPLNTYHNVDKGGFAWAVRKASGRVTPWNFDDKIDREKSAAAFIKNLTNKCTYLLGEDVLPKSSLLYSEFMLLNELNNIRIDGKPLETAVKEYLIEAVFKQDHKKMTKNRIEQFLKDNNYIPNKHKPDITGLDGEIKNDLTSYRDMVRILGTNFDRSIAEAIIMDITIFGESKKMLRETLRNKFASYLDDETIKKLSKLRYRDWGRLSKKLLNGIQGCDKAGDGTPETIIELMRNFSYNLMELLGDKFSFMEHIQEINDKLTEGQVLDPHDIIDELALSPAVKRAVWQALRIVDEVIHIKKALPSRIFVEVTRSNKTEKKKKDSRQKRLSDLYAAIKKDEALLSGLKGTEFDGLKSGLANYDDAALRSKKLYLYYTQMGRCAYTGEVIDLSQLNTDNYDIDHIYPRSLTKDDSFDNLVLCKRTANAQKSDTYPIAEDIQKSQKPFWTFLKQQGLISERKYERLTRNTPLTADDLSGFITRQLVETNQSVKAATTLLRRLYPDVDVVFVKAENVTDFRHDNNFIKVRSLNHHHHAKDAYLNIVVGNVYHEKFTRNFRAFFRQNGANRTYNLAKMFNYDVKCTNAKDGKAWDVKTSMDIVKKMMDSNDVRVTKRLLEQSGALADATVYKAAIAGKAKDGAYIGMKTKSSVFADVSKYGGMTKIKNAYSIIVQYVGKKGEIVKEIVPLPIYLTNRNTTDQDLIDYVASITSEAKDISIIYRKLCINQLVKVNGFYYYLGGKTNNNIYIDNAIELVVPTNIATYIKVLEKFDLLRKDNKVIKASTVTTRIYNEGSTAIVSINDKDGLIVYDYLMGKLRTPLYMKMKGNKVDELSTIGRNKFTNMTLEDQSIYLLEVLNLLTNSKTTFDVKPLGITASRSTIGVKIHTLDEFKIINESITGLYSNEITIV
ncbi:type II CRISPR RNA-guided endonuclease Cas9 [uncultured Veillonella sp.]|uniref:type II CRISPR RNA-guided endonuclease Cas9 n=1 Tax=uncultured Veillonella sp. TaxID=159268 RepID=UPI0028DCF1CE|nr:type II CRISPR RNA-guided endonuclease Cas9 [uncultured Veillonella sp.]